LNFTIEASYKQKGRRSLVVFVLISEQTAAKQIGPDQGEQMDVAKILAELRQERQQIEEAILSLERLARGRARGRGRPPAWLAQVTQPKRRGRPPGSKNKSSNSGGASQSGSAGQPGGPTPKVNAAGRTTGD
jgi:hypothetical protein